MFKFIINFVIKNQIINFKKQSYGKASLYWKNKGN